MFRKVTLENERLRALVRDLKFHHDPVGERSSGKRESAYLRQLFFFPLMLALQSMVITKQSQIGGEGLDD